MSTYQFFGLSSFWQGFFLFLIWLPILICWIFALVDLFQRDDLSGWAIALWLILIIFLPLLGTLLYFVFRPFTTRDAEAQEELKKEYEFEKAAKTADKLHKLQELLDKGAVTQEQFDKQKAKLLKE